MGIFDVGPLELIVIFIVALLVFGPNRLPEFMGQVGRWVRTLRRMSDEVTREFVRELNLDEARAAPYTYQPPLPPPPPYSPPPPEPSPPPAAAAEPAPVDDLHAPTADLTAAPDRHSGDSWHGSAVPLSANGETAPAAGPLAAPLNGAGQPAEPVADPSAQRVS
ncbi:MAG: Sec-independent protein translocase protein TatB [Chloroflexota bacterium]|nr:Sec-independent protein translocase protein TatB [Dehalococcoidia bacterium]MDW8254473.1 Sec-independent protein translocase protein TatB [Chloroflexota bacterium]